ncbi:DUF4097 family beta strand repeat-containing protein [Rhodanobacter sp. KK11]|uniref:DUF4097 family beta strand repeat-containing protein n=1 Tax=Rhodanobacter sp. KK11 TaxID=3083255 RepID=UPI0029660B56|nr:DUF4097 family beta strand repeat-containing protein [Rhodanobacter sp. KK11]MDW2982666.1 DUF4097 family beta strand repeat-containing protein [Rhodanobacter sp. KK11]
MKTTRYLPLLLCFCIGQALADTPIQLRHDATPTARISIGNIAGTVSVNAWDRNEVQVTGRLGDGAKPLAIAGSNGDLEIKVEPQGGSGWFNWGGDSRMAPTTLELHVPRAASLDVNVVSAPLVIDGMDGGSIQINTVSGKARINARTPSLKVDSVSGNIEQAGHAEQAALQTVSGDILAPALGREVELQTISGRIQAHGGPWRKLTLSTVSGDVQLGGALASAGSIGIDSMSGNVQLQLPANTSASLHASSFSGDLRSDFGTAKKPEHGPGSSLDARLGDGDGRINIETFSGDLRVRRQD